MFILGDDPAYIRSRVEVPEYNKVKEYNYNLTGIFVNKNAKTVVLPCVANYIGGDITGGILACGMHKSDNTKLLVDLGTNGELVLGNNSWMISCSCSAGPAFEGANISCGTRAVDGAISSISIAADLEPEYETINNVNPFGVCGSALIDLLASMFDRGIVDRQGRIERDLNHKRIRANGNIYEYVIVFKEEFELERDIAINENDINNLIRAKAAIYAGINILLNEFGLGYGDIEKIIIAGTLGKHINFNNAVKIGLLPDIKVSRYEFAGNLSLMGASMYAINYQLRDELEEIANSVTYIDLSEKPEFNMSYTAGLFLPHTDLSLFPSVKGV